MAKKLSNILLTFLTILIALLVICFFHATIVSAAEAETAPKIYCTYTDKNGDDVDGNKLTAGTYTINFVAEGFEKFSVVQVTASISEGAVVNDVKSLFSDTNANLVSIGKVNGDGNLAFGFVSDTEDNYVSLSGAVTLATIEMTFDSSCDAADYIAVSTNPNLTFVSTDYSLENNDEYALVDSFEGYEGELTLMECDVTPSMPSSCHTVSANLVIMTDAMGNTNNVPVYGEYTVDVYSDEARKNLVTSVKSQNIVRDDNKFNTFVIDDLADGTYYLTISSKYAITLNVVLNLFGKDILNYVIPVLVCDFDNNKSITVTDTFGVYQNIGNVDKTFDLDNDELISVTDSFVVYSCIGASYSDMTIE